MLEHQNRVFRIAAFLAQQAAEKTLKAILVAHSLPVPKIHDLRVLAERLPVPADALDAVDLELLNDWAIAGRYPADLPDELPRDEAEELCLAAERARGREAAARHRPVVTPRQAARWRASRSLARACCSILRTVSRERPRSSPTA
ncbi:MAG: HEPN domain-containing protein [Egibacteraceae bacterium]